MIKPTAAEPRLLQHTGTAVVFSGYADLKSRIDDEKLDVTADSVIVLQGAGPRRRPGMPEWGMLPIPKKLLKRGVRDMVRISDARMSGTSYGTCILHVSPESADRRPAGAGPRGRFDRTRRQSPPNPPARQRRRSGTRKAAWKPPERRFDRGYGQLFVDQITQAHEGCDFKFLHAGQSTPEPDIYSIGCNSHSATRHRYRLMPLTPDKGISCGFPPRRGISGILPICRWHALPAGPAWLGLSALPNACRFVPSGP